MNVQEVPQIGPKVAVAPELRGRFRASLRYLWTTEVHAYGFSIAANALLSFFPFALLLVTICERLLQWNGAFQVVVQLLRANLPTGADFVIRNLNAVMRARGQVQAVSVLLLFVTTSGIFLPLEVALNRVWGIRENRSYLGNLAVSVMLAIGAGLMALGSVGLEAVLESIVPPTVTRWAAMDAVLSRAMLETVSLPLMIGIFFVIYYVLPNDKVPAARVFPAAVCAALLSEAARAIFTWVLPALHFPEVYGPFAISASLLVWSFLGSLILLGSAAFFAYGYELDGGWRHSRPLASGRILRLEI
ncbi:MAG TPA: YihY/virulence factor BrkB family protein [Terriglobia bacterium]|nr:YihY/virulence factor BrkB family protein [Terriglobia bacterium]